MFYRLLRKYNATDVADFMAIIEEEETEFSSEVSLDEAMNSWITQGGYPLVTVIRNYEKGSAIIYQVTCIIFTFRVRL